MLYHWLIAL